MPFRGKPSSGCSECRRKRKKCDLRAEGCSRCAKAKRVCPGYPVQDGLRVCDQSSEIISKSSTARGKQTGMTSSVSLSSSGSRSPGESPSPLIRRIVMRQDTEDHSLAFFFRNYCVNNSKYHSFVDLPGNEHLVASIKAFGYAGISRSNSDTRLAQSARYRYVQALQLTNAALRDPLRVTSDETLLCILILVNYETLTGGVDRSLEAWEQHAKGATSLLSLRGEDGIKHDDGRMLTVHAIASITIVCLLQNLPVPADIHKLNKALFKYLHDPEDPSWVFQHVNLAAVDFRHAVSKGLITSPQEIITRAYELDARSVTIMANPPSYWEREFLGTRVMTATGLPDCQVRYWDQATAYVWCALHASRILLHELVLRTLQAAEAKGVDMTPFQHIREHSLSVVAEAQTEILAGVPQYLGLDVSIIQLYHLLDPAQKSRPSSPVGKVNTAQATLWTHFKDPSRYQITEVLRSDLPIMRAMGGYGIIWPLYAAGRAPTSTPAIRQYVARVYDHLGNHFRIEQALLLSKMLKEP